MKKISNKLFEKARKQARRKHRVEATIKATASRPRLLVDKSNLYIYAQIISLDGNVLASASDIKAKKGTKVERANEVGKQIAKIALDKGIKEVVFDRNGFLYHGRIKSLADGAREQGMIF